MKKPFLILAVFVSLQVFAQHTHQPGPTDKLAVHGMLIFGKEKIYASHLPLFHDGPHNYQIILELQLDNASLQKFIKDQLAHPEFTTYTIEPEKFVLPEMLNNPKPFKVNLYRGHFERGGVKIAGNIGITVKQIVYSKKFDPTESKSASSDFIVFGNNKEQFIAHRISNKPDFEQIIEVKADKQLLGSANSRFGLITLNPDSNDPLGVSGNDISFLVKDKKLVLLKQIYLEFDDLR